MPPWAGGRTLAAGTFAPAFAVSLVTILREGVEVILLLAMLIGLAVEDGAGGGPPRDRLGRGAGGRCQPRHRPGPEPLVASTQGRTRELVEGLVMLAASGVLFYVSYWLISQSESKRWIDFLKRQARAGPRSGGCRTLALTAFLAVYREGAETALMYQALLVTGHGQARAGGDRPVSPASARGSCSCVAIALVIRATSLRLPLRAFFKLTGVRPLRHGRRLRRQRRSSSSSLRESSRSTARLLAGDGDPPPGPAPERPGPLRPGPPGRRGGPGPVLAGEGTPSTSKRVGASGPSIESAPKAGVGV